MTGDLNGNKDFSVIKPFAFWTQHVLPLVYGDELSYMETLDKVVKLLNELIKNNNKLPEYIQQVVEEYITGGSMEEVLRGILADFILNVKYPPTGITPAKGDGTSNDYEAIQGCIDYAASKGGGVVYFPFGKYLTSKLTLKPNVSLMGFGKYCTSIVLTGGETDALLSGTVSDCGIYNITLDANMGIQVNNVDVITLTGSNIQLMNVILTEGYSLFNIEKTGDNIELNNVEFRNAVESMLRIGGTVGTLNANSIKFGNLSTIKGVAAIISDSNNDVITGIVSNDILPLFAQLDGNNNVLKGVVASTNVIAGDGQNNVYDFYGKTKSETYNGNVSEAVHGSKSTHINEILTRKVDGNSTEIVGGTKSEIVTGVSSAQYNGDRSVNGKNFTETMSGKKVINAQDIVLNPTNPLTYKTPTAKNRYFDCIPMKDNNSEYDVLVWNNETGKLQENTGALYDYPIGGASMSSFFSFHYPNTEPSVVQGMTVWNNQIIMVLWKEDNNAKIVVKSLSSGNTIRESDILAIGHGNSVEYYNGKLYIASVTNVFIVDFDTLTLERGFQITPSEDMILGSVFFVDDKLIGELWDGTVFKLIEINPNTGTYTLFLNLNPQPFTQSIQGAKYHNGYYYVTAYIPSTLIIYDSNGNLVNYTLLPKMVNGNIYNEIEDIGFAGDDIIMAFHNDSQDEGFANFAIIRTENSTRTYGAMSDLEIIDGLLWTTVYINQKAKNTLCNGTKEFPFHSYYEAIPYIKKELGGFGLIMLTAGDVFDTFKIQECSVYIKCNGATINGLAPENSIVTLLNGTINFNNAAIDSAEIHFIDCTINITGELKLYNVKLVSNTPIYGAVYVNPSSMVYADMRNKATNMLCNKLNSFTITALTHVGDTILRFTNKPTTLKTVLHTGVVTLSLDVNFAADIGEVTAYASYIYQNKKYDVYASFTLNDNALVYSGCDTYETTAEGVRTKFNYTETQYQPNFYTGYVEF